LHLELRKIFSCYLLAVLIVLSNIASSAQTPICDIRLLRNGTSLFVAPMPETFWQESGALRKVRDGLSLNIERNVKIVEHDGTIVNTFRGKCTLAYDLWAETYLLSDSFTSPASKYKFSKNHALDALLQCVGIPINDFKNRTLQTLTLINPIDKEQEERTREWLSTKGIGGSGSNVVSRALGAVIDLKTESVVKYDCRP
jgi:hypothetical protein